MKNILLRLTYILSWIVFIFITALWAIIMILPIFLGLSLLWVITGNNLFDDYGIMLVFCPILVPFAFKDYLEKRGVI